MDLEDELTSKIIPSDVPKPNFVSRLLFCWAVPIIWRGYKREVKQADICPPISQHTTEELSRRISNIWNQELRLANPSLYRTLIKMFGLEYSLTFIFVLIQQCILRPSLPLLLGLLIRYMNGMYSNEIGYFVAGAFVLFTFLGSMIYHACSFILESMGMRIRVSLLSLTYDKAVRLSQAAIAETDVGQLTNLISNDLNRFDRAMPVTPYIVASPIQMVCVGFVLWTYTGPACLAGIFFLILMIPLTGIIGRLIGRIRAKAAETTDRRVRLVTEILNGMLLLKMNAWENPYRYKMADVRRAEIKLIKRKFRLMALNYSLFEMTNKMSIFLTFLTYVLSDLPLSAETVFVTLAMYKIFTATSGIYFPNGVQGYSELRVSIARIQKFLLSENLKDGSVLDILQFNKSVGVKVKNLSASWPNSGHHTLSNVSFTVNSGEFLGVVGPVGSGKSTLIQAILGEVSWEDGTVQVHGKVAYASQEPCFFAGSIKENILFGQPFNPLWYAEVVEACALSQDLFIVISGEEILVADKGNNLSRGQKARINLARAVYSKADILLLDDPLSAVDVRVARHLMDKCIRTLLREKCVILVTHQTHYLKEATEVVYLEKGEITNRGSCEEVCGSIQSQNDSEFPTTIDDIILDETEDSGTSVKRKANDAAKGYYGYGTFDKQFAAEEVRGAGQIPWSLYVNYLRSGNSLPYLFFIAIFMLSYQAISNGSDIWLKAWTDSVEADQTNVTSSALSGKSQNASYFYLGVYGGLVVALFVVALIRSLHVFYSRILSAQTLHRRLFSAILRAPMRFFEVNSVGRILNRFSNDMGVMDEYLPDLFFVATATLLKVLGAMVVVTIMSPWLIIPALVQLFLFYWVRRIYVLASVRFKRLEGTSRSPIFAHFNTTLTGIAVIRAQGAENMFRERFNSYQNIHTSNYYTVLSTSRWFQITTELISDLYISCVLLYFVLFTSSATKLGLAVSAALTLILDASVGMTMGAQIVNQIISVERVIDYTNVKPEAALRNPSIPLSSAWIEKGDIRLDNVTVAYENGFEVLRDINFQIQAGEKIGIVGRTGAEKSSLIASLFRIVEPSRGKIHIDNVDVCQIGLHDLRSQLAIIPQSPVLFSGTIRQNLDPFHEYPDAAIWNALESVQLKSRIQQSLGQNLDLTVSEGGSNFSRGEKQLICLARTIVRKSKILILDEATANIDTNTDAIIQDTLRKRFSSSTVITVAHRLKTVMDNDRILVLDAGRVIEFDEPSNLLRDQQSFLYKLVANTGPENADKLRNMATEAERKKKVEVTGSSI